jgi:uncharacterized membrane protein
MDSLYRFLGELGYTHPLHPPLTHVPIGCIVAGFLFAVLAFFLKQPSFSKTARHCLGLALVALPLTAFAGYLDWQHNYGGAWLWPIRIKLLLAGILLAVLIVAHTLCLRKNQATVNVVLACLVCLGLAGGLGFYGGELVYGKQEAAAPGQTAAFPDVAAEGRRLFAQKCSACHYPDQTAMKIGPGLKGLFSRDQLSSSGWPATEENVRRQITAPFETMPAFNALSDQEMQALMAYLKTL